MDDSHAISVRNLSKKYRLYGSAKERLKEALHPFKKRYHREFWALRDVSFDVPKGQTFGIIGRNGSGKSTLLQTIFGILQPTGGAVQTHGRISALLELGAGFNPQFTGRENVVFNGMLTGFSRSQMHERLADIAAFADIGEFIDQPVKTYSSGMFVRLAFAAAINVDPDILIVDEALAVGDVKFQRKCYDKFQEFHKAGKTLVWVTHNTAAVARHCDRALLLENGQILQRGGPRDVINKYWEIMAGTYRPDETPSDEGTLDEQNSSPSPESSGKELTDEVRQFLSSAPDGDACLTRPGYNPNENRYGDKRAEIVDCLIVSDGQCAPGVFDHKSTIDLYIKVRFHQRVVAPTYGFKLKTADGVIIYATNNKMLDTISPPEEPGELVVWKFTFPLTVAPGDYFLDLGTSEQGPSDLEGIAMDRRYDVIHINVIGGHPFDGMVNLECDASQQTVCP